MGEINTGILGWGQLAPGLQSAWTAVVILPIHLLLDPSFTLQVAPYTLGPCHFRGVTFGCQVPCHLGGGLGTVCYQEAELKGPVIAGVQSHDQSGHAEVHAE